MMPVDPADLPYPPTRAVCMTKAELLTGALCLVLWAAWGTLLTMLVGFNKTLPEGVASILTGALVSLTGVTVTVFIRSGQSRNRTLLEDLRRRSRGRHSSRGLAEGRTATVPSQLAGEFDAELRGWIARDMDEGKPVDED